MAPLSQEKEPPANPGRFRSFVGPVYERGLIPVPTTMPIPGTEWLPRWLKRKIVNAGPTRLTDPATFLNDIAKELGVEPVPSLAALMHADLTLVTDLPEIVGIPEEALEAWRPREPSAYRSGTRLTYTGPLFARLEQLIPGNVQAFMDGGQPTAYVVLSSSTPEMLRAVTQRALDAGLRVIVGATIHDYGPANDPRVVVAGILPSHLIMPRVDVAITMGGQGSVQTAMASGCPLVGIPLHSEQELSVGLAARQGMAVAVAPRHAGTTRMTKAIRHAAFDSDFRKHAKRVAAIYAGVDGASNAAAAILRFLTAPEMKCDGRQSA